MKRLLLVLCCVLFLLPFRAEARTTIDRGIETRMFVPKNTWLGGCSFSYNEHLTEDLHFLLIDNINTQGYTFEVCPYVAYTFKDDMAAGFNCAYSRSLIDLSRVDVNLGDDLSFNLKDNIYQSHMFLCSGFLRTYMSIGGSKVFGFFNELRLTYGYGQGKIAQPDKNNENAVQGTYERSHKLQIGITPGLTAFITNNVAAEVSINLMGLNFDWTDQITNQVETSKKRNSSANFKINLFAINLGLSFFF